MDRLAASPVDRPMGMSTAGSREINVTPLIDVLLVLLVIFLIIMPILLRSLTVELPPKISEPSEPQISVGLKLEADLSMTIDDGPRFPSHELASRLRPQLGKAAVVFVDSGDGVRWGQVVSTVDTVRGVVLDTNPAVKVAVRLRDE